MRYYFLKTKAVLRFSPKASEFFKAYTSNVPEAPKNAFLDRSGKIVATCDQLKISLDEILVVIEGAFRERLLKHLEKFLLFSETKIEYSNLKAYYDLDKSYVLKKDDYEILFKDTRLILTEKNLESTVSEEDFRLYRLRHHLPIQGIDYDEEMLLNIGNEDYVNYEKGCYLGQEIIARVHYKSKPPRKLIVTFESPQTSVTIDPETGKSIGFSLALDS